MVFVHVAEIICQLGQHTHLPIGSVAVKFALDIRTHVQGFIVPILSDDWRFNLVLRCRSYLIETHDAFPEHFSSGMLKAKTIGSQTIQKCLGAIKLKGSNKIANIGQVPLYLREENLSVTNNYMVPTL